MHEKLISSLSEWGEKMLANKEKLELATLKSRRDNKWFEIDQQWKAIEAICEGYLTVGNLDKWLSEYEIDNIEPKNIGLICAGNIPAVGFHDVLTILVSGHRGKVKLSSKDEHLLPTMLEILKDIDEDLAGRITCVDRLADYDAVIATGSDNSARYFYSYFKDVPHLIRKNRQGLAVIDENITDVELKALREDIFSYYGLGCRNVAMIMLPHRFDKERLYASLMPEKSLRDNDKYNNNYNYNLALCMLDHEDFKTNDELLFIERDSLHSRIATIHLNEYDFLEELHAFMDENKDKIQCVVANQALHDKLNCDTIKPGETQQPNLWDYADGVDTLHFLNNLC